MRIPRFVSRLARLCAPCCRWLLPLLLLPALALALGLVAYLQPPVLLALVAAAYPEVLFHVPLSAKQFAARCSSTAANRPECVISFGLHPFTHSNDADQSACIAAALAGRRNSSNNGSVFTARGTRVIALTIDDAPSEHTEAILQLLRDHDARATFFVIGSRVLSRERKQLLRRMVAEGHELANHLMWDEPSIQLSALEFGNQMRSLDAILFPTTTTDDDSGSIIDCNSTTSTSSSSASSASAYHPISQYRSRPKWLRPGSAWFNQNMLDAAKASGYRVVLGDAHPFDAQISDPWLNAFYLVTLGRALRPGAIVILHDRHHTIQTLADALPRINAAGFQVVTLSELASLGDILQG